MLGNASGQSAGPLRYRQRAVKQHMIRKLLITGLVAVGLFVLLEFSYRFVLYWIAESAELRLL